MPYEAYENDDSYGPGSDLMVSLFSIAILLLGIVGVGQQFGDAQQAVNRLAERTVTPPNDERQPRITPLKLISPEELAMEANRRAAAESRAAELAAADVQSKKAIDELNERLKAMQDALKVSETRLEALRIQKPDGRLDILSHAFPISALAKFLEDPSAISISLNAEDVQQIRAAITPYVPQANQIFVETTAPPELFAFMPSTLDDGMAINRIYLLSAAIAQAYQQAFARNGVPLACISIIVRSLEESPEVRLQALVEASDAVDAFSELATYYRPMDRGEAGRAQATVRIQLGAADERQCDAGALEKRLSNLKPE